MIPRSNSLLSTTLGLAFAGLHCLAGLAQDRIKPNVVILYADDLGTLDAGCYGSTDLDTPHIDSLAKTGVRFTQGYAHTVCCPSRALLLTGRHPQRSNVNSWMQSNAKGEKGLNMNVDETTLAEVLRGAEYRTGLFGKWHLGAHFDHGPTRQGFDEFFGIRNGFIDNFNHFYLHREGFHDLYEGTREVFHDGKYFPDLATERALAFLEENQNRPFFLYLGFNIPHYPEQADPKFDARYADLDEPRRSYAKIVSTTDDHIGRVLRQLETLGIRDKTIVVFVSDNGHSSEDYEILVEPHNSGLPKPHNYGANGGGGNTGKWRGAKGSFFEGGIRVPMIINFPTQLPEGVVRDQAVSIADFFPTLLELCDVPQPNIKLDGKSMIPVIRSPNAPSAHSIFHWQWQQRWVVREGNWKLIFNGRDTTDRWQGHPDPRRNIPKIFLGNLDDEQPELTNHAPDQTERVARLMSLHEAWSKDVFESPTP